MEVVTRLSEELEERLTDLVVDIAEKADADAVVLVVMRPAKAGDPGRDSSTFTAIAPDTGLTEPEVLRMIGKLADVETRFITLDGVRDRGQARLKGEP